MHITFYGAAHEVTGSNSLVEIGDFKLLVDCGMYQGSEEIEKKNAYPLPYDAKTIGAVVITHAHLDHVGRLPLLIKGGYNGYFYATAPTREFVRLTLEDTLNIMTFDHKKFGKPVLFSQGDIEGVMGQFKSVEYYQPLKMGEMVVTFHEAGHIFGSAFIEINAEGKTVVFSGDVGNVNVPILRDTDPLPNNIDALVCESTYGDRLHENKIEREKAIEHMFTEAIARGGVLMIPSFSIERTQELIYELNDLIDHHHALPRVPIFLDSPMAIDALKVYRKYPQYYDAEAERFVKLGDDIFDFPGLVISYTREESMKINHIPGAKIIIAGAGMMNGGRILHHALRHLSDEKSTLLIVGYQSHGTLGRNIMEGKSPVTVLGESVQVRCQVKSIGAMSAHGDQNKLVSWIGGLGTVPKKVYLNHGDPPASAALADRLKNDLHADVTVVTPQLRVEV